VLLLVTTICFPRAAAAMSWVDEVIADREKKTPN
jgi:hypothetical protein